MGQESASRRAATLEQLVEPLLEGLRPRIEQILCHYRIPPQDAEDLVQEILISLVRRYESIHSPEAWLVTALKYQCLLYWRQRRRRLYELVDQSLLESLASPVPSPSNDYDQAHDLASLLPQLPQRCSRVLRLRYELGLTPRELAAELGYRYSSVSKIVKRCLAALTARLVAVRCPKTRADA